MGNSTEKTFAGAGMFIEYDQASYQAGQTINGTIQLNVQEPYQSNSLTLRVEGLEKIKFYRQEGR